jgi:C-terminal processing protease CtpA/Prc
LAEQAGIKLGDSILKINGVDTAKMSLGQAQRAINEVGGQLKMTTAK